MKSDSDVTGIIAQIRILGIRRIVDYHRAAASFVAATHQQFLTYSDHKHLTLRANCRQDRRKET